MPVCDGSPTSGLVRRDEVGAKERQGECQQHDDEIVFAEAELEGRAAPVLLVLQIAQQQRLTAAQHLQVHQCRLTRMVARTCVCACGDWENGGEWL